MIVYSATKQTFLADVDTNRIGEIILERFKETLHRKTSVSEVNSWTNSMQYMDRVLRDGTIPDDCNVAIEYQIPRTSNRIDFLITGENQDRNKYAILIELKQWSEAKQTDKDAIVQTYLGGSRREVSHPSYQAWSYVSLLEGYNEAVYEGNISLKPCAYLHNYKQDGVIDSDFYKEHIERAPLFLQSDAAKLREFIKKYIKYGDSTDIIYSIENGTIRPSKVLADSIVQMLKGNKEFILIDDQKLVYETAVSLSKLPDKNVLIIEGGPGTGKTVVAINLLVELTKRGKTVQYVSKNAAPRSVYENKLTGTYKKTAISNMFKGSGSYVDAEENSIDALIVDEAHRLNEKSGLYGNLGDNQVKEIIHASKFSVFFIDESQRVTLKDIGQVAEIEQWAKLSNAKVHRYELTSQFRCNGSDGYIGWLDNSLQIRETANYTLDGINYDFKVFDSPVDLKIAIEKKNQKNNKSRLVAGYCWDWVSKKKPSEFDITIPGFDFKMKWNLTQDGSLWIIKEESVNEIGCIHTCQGLDLDYVGVIVGEDLIVRNGVVQTKPEKRSRQDKSIFGWKKLVKDHPNGGADFIDEIIRNTYRTLMTRGLKGCYLYCVDKETNEYFKERAKKIGQVY